MFPRLRYCLVHQKDDPAMRQTESTRITTTKKYQSNSSKRQLEVEPTLELRSHPEPFCLVPSRVSAESEWLITSDAGTGNRHKRPRVRLPYRSGWSCRHLPRFLFAWPICRPAKGGVDFWWEFTPRHGWQQVGVVPCIWDPWNVTHSSLHNSIRTRAIEGDYWPAAARLAD
jgi:hypothetical protein